ncbi:MAG: DUF6962 family protein [Pirellulaceae bacterium]
MTEPDVALTDFLLTAQCGAFSYWLSRMPAPRRRRLQSLCVQFFAVVGLASLVGGAVHGYFHDESTRGFQILWRLGLVILGAGSYFSWLIGAELLFRDAGRKLFGRIALAGLLLYAAYVLFWDQHFLFAILNYLPATLFLFVAFVLQIRTGPRRAALYGASSVLVTLAAAAAQMLHIAPHPTYLNHNAVYHLLQAVALVLLLVAFRGFIGQVERDNVRPLP